MIAEETLVVRPAKIVYESESFLATRAFESIIITFVVETNHPQLRRGFSWTDGPLS